jgi:hypothetical protein
LVALLGFRLLKVTRVSLLIAFSTVVWALVGGYSFDELDKDNGQVPVAIFVGFALVGALIAWWTDPPGDPCRIEDARSDSRESEMWTKVIEGQGTIIHE